MFSKLQSIALIASSAQALETFYPSQAVVTDQAGTYTQMTANIGGTTVDVNTGCQLCIIGGGEFVATTKAEYTSSVKDAKMAGQCCVYGKTNAANYCTNADTSAKKLSTEFKQPEIAIANCPNLKANCDGNPTIDVDAKTDAENRIVGGSAVTFNQDFVCSYIATSKCGAPTVSFNTHVNQETTKDDKTINSLWDVTYMEFSENVNADYTQAKAEVTDKMAKCMKTDGLGGDMWPVNWYDKDGKVLSAPAETFAKWIGVSNTAYAKYTTDTTAASYKTAIDVWNFHARQVSWLKEWLKTNTGKTAPDATVLKTYTDKLVSAPADAAGTIAKLAPEKPEVPPMPASYNGPALKPKDTKDADRKDMFELIGGMGRPSIGKLIVKDALGTQHMFGVRGTGNTATNADADVKKDPNAVSLLYPAQDSDTTKCKPSTLVVIVRGTKAQTKVGNKVTLSFKKEAFATNPLVLNAKPTETTLKPLDREAASYIATGLATVALVAASLY